MREPIFRASSIHRLMTEPRSKTEGPLSKGAKTYIGEVAAQDILGVRFGFSSRETKKGIAVEQDAIEMVAELRGWPLVKNEERRTLNGLSGECDLYHAPLKRGIDIKCPWSPATFPLTAQDADCKEYEWQARAYMALWDASEWEVAYCLMDTPAELVGADDLELHIVSHIPAKRRVTSVVYRRDPALEQAMFEKIAFAKEHYLKVVQEFEEAHA